MDALCTPKKNQESAVSLERLRLGVKQSEMKSQLDEPQPKEQDGELCAQLTQMCCWS